MPRFSKPVVEDENGELIIPGAYEAAPGGFVERRSTFEWDNNDRASGLINVDELSVALSDSENDDGDNETAANQSSDFFSLPSLVTRTTTTTGISTARQQSMGTTVSGASSAIPPDEEQGLPLPQQQQQPQRQSSASSGQLQPQQQSTQLPPSEDQVVTMEAAVVVAPEAATSNDDNPQRSSSSFSTLGSEVFRCGKAKTKRVTWIRAILIGSFVIVGMAMIGLTQRRKRQGGASGQSPGSGTTSTAATDSESFAPPTPELANRSDSGLQSSITKVVTTPDKLQPNWSSPYYQALYWMLYEDPLQLTPQDNGEAAVQQRFLVAAFYFSTSTSYHRPSRRQRDLLLKEPKRRGQSSSSEDDEATKPQRPEHRIFWRHCGAPSFPPSIYNQTESWTNVTIFFNNTQFLKQQHCVHQDLIQESPLKFERHPQSWRWLSATPECDWAGVTCNQEDLVVSIVLADYGLSGTLIEELGFLTSLHTLSLPHNANLGGQVPSSILRQVTVLELQHNQHTSLAVVDDEALSNNSSNSSSSPSPPLQVLRMASNSLSGSLSEQLLGGQQQQQQPKQQFAQLQELSLEQNSLTGTLPAQLQWPQLEVLRLDHNRLSGTIPPSLVSASSSLQTLDLSRNVGLTGSIPSEIGLAAGATMTQLRLARCQLQGTLPLELYDLTNLVVLDLQHNSNLQGTMATEIGQLSHLEKLYWQENQFEGSLPTELGHLHKIADFRINGNDFSGDIPLEFCDLGIQDLPLAYSADVVADCSQEEEHDDDATTTTAAPEQSTALQCPEGCCSTCCSKSTGQCTLNPFSILGIRSGNGP